MWIDYSIYCCMVIELSKLMISKLKVILDSFLKLKMVSVNVIGKFFSSLHV